MKNYDIPSGHSAEYLAQREQANQQSLEITKPHIYKSADPVQRQAFDRSLQTFPERAQLAPWSSQDPYAIRTEAVQRGILIDTFPDILKDIAKSKRPAEHWDVHPNLMERYISIYDRPSFQTYFEFPWRKDGAFIVGGDERTTRQTIYSRTIDQDPRLITPQDFEAASELKVGIIGMGVGTSVGNSLIEFGVRNIRVADGGTIAMHDFSRLPAAGFPRIELNHATHWARMAYEMYPYGNFDCIPQNIGDGSNGTYSRDAFLEGLDVVFEVVDNLPEKIRTREAARANGIPVFMPTDIQMGADMMYQPGNPDAQIFPNLSEEEKRKVTSGEPMDFEEKSALAHKLVGDEADYWSQGARRGRSNWAQTGASAAVSKAAVAQTLRRFLRGQEIPNRKKFLLDEY